MYICNQINLFLYLYSSEWQYRTASLCDHLCSQKITIWLNFLSKCLFLFSRQTLGLSFFLGFFLDTSEPQFSILIPHCLGHLPQTRLISPYQLTSVHSLRIRNLNALAYLGKKCYLCIEMSGKGSDSRMSDECLMNGESGLLYFGEYQAGMQKFTLAPKTCGI